MSDDDTSPIEAHADPTPPLVSSEARLEMIGQLGDEFVERLRRGERPSIREYMLRYPDHAEEIRDVLETLATIEELPSGSSAPRTAAKESLPQCGDYRLLREIGRGGMGVVYEAEQISLGRHVALKMMPRAMLADPVLKARFEREAKAAAKLHHTNIVPVFGVGESDGDCYYVMQFIDGIPLDALLQQLQAQPAPQSTNAVLDETLLLNPAKEGGVAPSPRTPLAADSAHAMQTGAMATAPPAGVVGGVAVRHERAYSEFVATIGKQVASALAYAHSQGILHRDIKPSNLMLDAQGTAWVTDFGLAKFDDDRGLTQTGDILGTLRYMAPESFNGQADARSDLYSLGLTLYEMLVFRPAFDKTNRPALIEQVLHAEIPPLDQSGRDVPLDLRTIVHKALDRSPEHRYQTAHELADDLERFLNDEPIRARPLSAMERAARWSRRNKGLSLSLSSLAVLVLVTMVGSLIAAGYFRSLSDELSTSVGKLTTTQGQLNTTIDELKTSRDKAREQAEENARLAIAAEKSQHAAKTQLADSQTQQGLLAGAAGDAARAALWFSQAALQTPHDPLRQSENSVRARNWLEMAILPLASRQIPTPERLAAQPGGGIVLTLNQGQLQLWDWRHRHFLPWTATLPRVTDAAWAPDGKSIAVGLEPNGIQIHDAPSGKVLHQWSVPAKPESVLFDPAGQRLVVAAQGVHLWSLEGTPRQLSEWPHPQPVKTLLFNRVGTRLITACDDQLARVFATDVAGLARKEPLFDPKPHNSRGTYSSFAVAPLLVDGDRTLITRTVGTNAIKWWNMDNGENAAPPAFEKIPPIWVMNMAASPDGKWLALGCVRSCELFDLAGRQRTIKHPHHVVTVAFTPDNKFITGCYDWRFREWSLDDPDRLPMVFPHLSVPQVCLVSGHGELVTTFGEGSQLRLWQRKHHDPLMKNAANWAKRWRPRISADGRLATLGKWHEEPDLDRPCDSITCIEVETGTAAGPVIPQTGIVDSCILSDQATVAIAVKEELAGRLDTYRIVTGERLLSLNLPASPKSVAVRPDKPQMAVLCTNGATCVFDQRNGKSWRTIFTEEPVSEAPSPRVLYSDDGQSLIVSSGNVVDVYDPETGERRYPTLRPTGAIRSLAVSADSRWLATAVNGRNEVRVWNLQSGAQVSPALHHPGDGYGIFTVNFSPDGQTVLTSNKDGRARLWDWKTGQLACPPLQHDNEVVDAVFTPDGRHALTTSHPGIGHVWELTTGRLIAPPFDHPLDPKDSTNTLVVSGTRAIAGGHGYPIIDLQALLAEPVAETETMLATAELAAGAQMLGGDLSGLSQSEWQTRWDSDQSRFPPPELIVARWARALKGARDSSGRQSIVDRAATEPGLLEDLAEACPEIAEIPAVLARQAQARNDSAAAAAHRQQAQALLEPQWKQNPGDFAVTRLLADLVLDQLTTTWHRLTPESLHSTEGAILSQRDDGATLVSKPSQRGDTYTITARCPLDRVTAVRLEVLTDPSLPYLGPGWHEIGDFQLAAIRAWSSNSTMSENATGQVFLFDDAWATYFWNGPSSIDIRGPIQPQSKKCWSVCGQTGMSHHAIYALSVPADTSGQSTLRIELVGSPFVDNVNLGCFRLSVCNDERVLDKVRVKESLRNPLSNPWVQLGSAYTLSGDEELAYRAFELAFQHTTKLSTAASMLDQLEASLAIVTPLRQRPIESVAFHEALAQRDRAHGDAASAEQELDRAIALLERQLPSAPNAQPIETDLARLRLERTVPAWQTVQVIDVQSTAGIEYKQQTDGSLLAADSSVTEDRLTLRIRCPQPDVATIRLTSLPEASSNPPRTGIARLTELRGTLQRADGTEEKLHLTLTDDSALSTLPWKSLLLIRPWGGIDGDPKTARDFCTADGSPVQLTFRLNPPCRVTPQDVLVLHLDGVNPTAMEAPFRHFQIEVGDHPHAGWHRQWLSAVQKQALTGTAALAAAHLVAGETAAARKSLDHPVETEGDDFPRQVLLAYTLHQQGELTAAQTIWSECRKRRSHSPFASRAGVFMFDLSTTLGGMETPAAVNWLAELRTPPFDRVEELVGHYQRRPVENDWHDVTLTHIPGKPDQLLWKNKAGVRWTLTLGENGSPLRTDKSCPYFSTGEPWQNVVVEFHPETDGETPRRIHRLLFGQDAYERVAP